MAVVNGLLLYLVNVWPGWAAVPFLTDDAATVMSVFNISLGVGIIVNIVNAVTDLLSVSAVAEIISSSFAIVVLILTWNVFPFEFDHGVVDWELIVRVVIGFAVAGCLVSIIVQVLLLIRVTFALTESSHEVAS